MAVFYCGELNFWQKKLLSLFSLSICSIFTQLYFMKKIILTSLVTLLVFNQFLLAQSIEQKFLDWTQQNPIEKIYLHIDRENYHAGQTIWFKGYFTNGFVPSANSSNLYVELLNNRSEVVVRNIFPVYLGSTAGQLDLPSTLEEGVYQIRAYSPVMLNQPGFVFYKRIDIYGTQNKKQVKDNKSEHIELSFFPEGGNLITGKLNRIAFKAIDKNGMPIEVAGEITDNSGKLITSFNSVHDGMGSFAILPQNGETYIASINNQVKKYSLPAQTSNGIIFSVHTTARGKQFRIEQGTNDPVFKPAYLVGQMENELLFKQPLTDKKEFKGLIETKDFISGILHLTVFNKDNMPLAERLTFIDNKDYVLPAILKMDTLSGEEKAKNSFTLALKDTIIGNFSVSVTDADYENTEKRNANIYSWFLLNSDIKGYIHHPAYYFGSEADSVSNALDLVMMTNGWTRFKWTDLLQNKMAPTKYSDPGYIHLKGTVFLEGRKKVLSNKDIILLMSQADTTLGRNSFTRFLRTDSLGRFDLDSLRFFDKMKLLFSDIRGNKSKFITIKLDNDSLSRKYPLEVNLIPFADTSSLNMVKKMSVAYSDYLKAEGTTLATVTVRARQKTETEKLDEEYSSALFSNNINGRLLDLRNEVFGGDIFQYLQGRVAGLTVEGSPGNYVLKFRGGGFGNGGNVSLFLDEAPTDAIMIEGIPVSQIAIVKLLPQSIATPGGGAALAIYLKKGADLAAAIDSPTDLVYYKGYTIIKEFYQPDYSKNPNSNKADTRLTLSWNPNIFIASINPQIPIKFYNNDRTKRFKIVAEGITNEGRLLMFEKIIETGK